MGPAEPEQRFRRTVRLRNEPSLTALVAVREILVSEVVTCTEDGRRETLASSRPAHRLDDDVNELASFCKGAALAGCTGANPRQPVDPDLDALDIAKPFKGVVHVDD